MTVKDAQKSERYNCALKPSVVIIIIIIIVSMTATVIVWSLRMRKIYSDKEIQKNDAEEGRNV